MSFPVIKAAVGEAERERVRQRVHHGSEVEPLRHLAVVKDLAVEMTDFFDKWRDAKGNTHRFEHDRNDRLVRETRPLGQLTQHRHDAAGSLIEKIDPDGTRHLFTLDARTRLLGHQVRVDGTLLRGVTAKDVVLHITGVLGAAGGTGSVIEYTGQVIRDLSIEGRLTISNMAIEHGARAGLCAPDEKTFAYLRGRPYAPKGEDWDKAVAWWTSLATDPGATYDKVVVIDAKDIAPSVTWEIGRAHV